MRRTKVFEGYLVNPAENALETFLNKHYIKPSHIISISYAFDSQDHPHILLVYEDD